MAATNGTRTETLSGLVEATNDKGIKVGGRWFNYSQYATVPHPERGQRVVVRVTGNFIKALDVVEGGEGSHSATERSGGCLSTSEVRQTVITRLAVLKAAAGFLAAREKAKSSDVLKVAELWEGWVTRVEAVDKVQRSR